MIWARDQSSFAPAALSGTDLLTDLRADLGGAIPLGTTVTRVRIDFQVKFAANPTSSDAGTLVGLIVADRNTAVDNQSSPDQDPHVDWMFWRFHPYAASGIGGGYFAGTIDCRSQRKMEEAAQTLFFMQDTDPANVADTMNVFSSVLLKLP